MDNQSNQLVLRDHPFVMWAIGISMLGACGYFLLTGPEERLLPLISGILGLLIFGFSPIVTVRADRSTGVLSIERRSLLRNSKREIPFSEIQSIQVEHSTSYDSDTGSHSNVYRVVIQTSQQEIIPLRSGYSSGLKAKEAKAQKLSTFLGVGMGVPTPYDPRSFISGLTGKQFIIAQDAPGGNASPEQVTDGIHWSQETTEMGGAAVARWFSPDFSWEGNFLFLIQKMQGQSLPGGLLSMMSKTIFRASLSLFGFGGDLTPGLEHAEVMAPLDPKIEPFYLAFTSDPIAARRLLNSWAEIALANWAQKHPFQQRNTTQMAVLFSPAGLFVAASGSVSPDDIEELITLGVELAKTQSSH